MAGPSLFPGMQYRLAAMKSAGNDHVQFVRSDIDPTLGPAKPDSNII